MAHILVVGAGSIGQRHIRNLVELWVEKIDVVDSNIHKALATKKIGDDAGYPNGDFRYGTNLSDAIHQKPDAAIVAVPTYLHSEVAIQLLQADIKTIFIEKPVAHNLKSSRAILNDRYPDQRVVIGYSLRFHPALQIIRDLLPQIGIPLYAHAEVGQYLPDWHPNEDYRQWYMAKEELGGGALLDLSHEIDYLQFLLGEIDIAPEYIRGFVDHLAASPLEIDSDSIADFLISFNGETLASVHMDLLDRSYNRRLRIVGTDGTISWDWNEGKVILWTPTHKEGIPYVYPTDRNIQFMEEMKAFIKLVETSERDERFCTLEDGLKVMEILEELKRQNGRA